MSSFWLHVLAFCVFLMGALWAITPKSDYDFGVGFRAFMVILGYCVYWIAYLAFTR